MGSFDMNASFSKMPILDETTVIICLKRKHKGYTSLIPLAYPVVGHYWDYGEVHDFKENEITKVICDFFDFDNMDDVMEFIYNMTIHGDYKKGLQKIDKGENPYEEDRFYKYVEILDRLRKNSGVTIENENNIVKKNEERLKKASDGWKQQGKSITEDYLETVNELWIKSDLSRNQELRELLDSYELALFYENTPLFDALCSYPDYNVDRGTPYIDFDHGDDVSVWGKYLPDKNNVWCITKDCNSPETIELKKGLRRLWDNFRTEGKKFSFTETSIMGQEDCPYMWYRYGKAAHKLWRDRMNKYSKVDIETVDKGS